MNVVQNRNIFLSFSTTLVVISWLAIFIFGLRPGIDLRGGTQWQIKFSDASVTESSVRDVFTNIPGTLDISLKRTDDGSFIIRLPDITEEIHQTYVEYFTTSLGTFEEQSFSSIGPTIGKELRTRSLWAIIAVLLGISLYVAWAFRKISEPIKSWKYGIVTLITLLHDVSIPAGLLAYLGWSHGIEIDTNFIVALLVVIGFSVHDTIVVFDRIREMLIHRRGQSFSLKDVINESIRSTLTRSINTSATLFVVLVALIFIGPPTLFYFILVILIGTVVGTYSSIFLASPILYIWGKHRT